jgi:N-ethylmaleimide reductase
MSNADLFSPVKIGDFEARNRIVMAPMTRSRAEANGVPSELAIEYYTQRASAGMIITEGTAPSAGGIGYARTPGIHSDEQIAAWKKITDAVRAKGGRMFCQFMHVGRIAHGNNRYTDEQPVAPSAVKAEGQMWTDQEGLQDHPTPRALETDEIPGVIEEYAQATRNALAAGFDGVELHAASGYLPMQFLSSNTNLRDDQYGGSANNRIRFVIECLEAMIAAAGSSSKVGIKISPAMPFNDIHDADPKETYTTLVPALDTLNLAYLHVLRTALPETFDMLKPLYNGTFAVAGGFEKASGNEAIQSGLADFVVYGKLFTSNPDLPERFAADADLVEWNPDIFYSPGPEGYTTYTPM